MRLFFGFAFQNRCESSWRSKIHAIIDYQIRATSLTINYLKNTNEVLLRKVKNNSHLSVYLVGAGISNKLVRLLAQPFTHANAGMSLQLCTAYQSIYDRHKHGSLLAFVGDEKIGATSLKTFSCPTKLP